MKADALRVNLNAPKWLEMEFLQTKTRQGRWIDNNSYDTRWLTCWYLVVMCWCQIRWMVQMAKSEIQKGLGRIHVTAQRDTKSVLTHRNCLVYLSTHLRTYNKKKPEKSFGAKYLSWYLIIWDKLVKETPCSEGTIKAYQFTIYHFSQLTSHC